jgi:hypothetical protein
MLTLTLPFFFFFFELKIIPVVTTLLNKIKIITNEYKRYITTIEQTGKKSIMAVKCLTKSTTSIQPLTYKGRAKGF